MSGDVLACFPDTMAVVDGHLTLGGVDAVELTRTFGTPLYVYDAATLRNRIRAYRRALADTYAGPSTVTYAGKAFLCTALVHFLAQEDLDLDVVSGGELHVALQGGISAARLHLHGNNKSPAELAQALDVGVGRIVVDNAAELARLEVLAAGRESPVRIWLRLSPNVDAHTHAYRKTGLLDSKFGFSIATGDAVRAAEQAAASPHLQLTGLHAHVGSQLFDVAPFVQTVEALLEVVAALHAQGIAIDELSPGGGFGVRYVPEDPAPAPAEYVRAIARAVTEGCAARSLSLPRLILEPGRSIVGPAGVALYTVGARKVIPGVRTYVAVDGGLADNPRPALYGARYTALLANRAAEETTETVTVVGKYCESGDRLIDAVALSRPVPGDVLAIPVSGAYQLSMSSNYNLALRPAVVLVEDGDVQLWQRRESYKDLLRQDPEL